MEQVRIKVVTNGYMVSDCAGDPSRDNPLGHGDSNLRVFGTFNQLSNWLHAALDKTVEAHPDSQWLTQPGATPAPLPPRSSADTGGAPQTEHPFTGILGNWRPFKDASEKPAPENETEPILDSPQRAEKLPPGLLRRD